MVRKTSDIEKELLRLPRSERTRLIRVLIASLDNNEDDGSEQAWLHEAERRLGEYEAGIVESRPAEDVFADLDRRFE